MNPHLTGNAESLIATEPPTLGVAGSPVCAQRLVSRGWFWNVLRQKRRGTKTEAGATAIEYALMVGLISVGIIGATLTLKGKINSTLGKVLGERTYTNVSTYASAASPTGIAVDSNGTVYVSERYNNRIRKITTNGTVSTLAGSGSQGSVNANGTSASFNDPYGLAVDAGFNVYVAEYGNGLVRKITANGDVTTLAAIPGVLGLSVNSSGVVSAVGYNYTLNQISPAGVVTVLAGTAGASAWVDGTGPAARFSAPYGITEDSAGNFFVTDLTAEVIRKVTPAGVVSTFAGTNGAGGTTDGSGAAARFSYPVGIAIDPFNNLFVCDYNSHRIRKITPDGAVTTVAGAGVGGINGPVNQATFTSPNSIAVSPSGDLYVSEEGGHRVRKIT